MPIDFYYLPFSPICRSVMLTAKAVGVEFNYKLTNSLAGETKTPEFKSINPQHCIPTIVDGDFVLWESRVICTYLASQYGNDALCPKDPKKRAEIDRLLFFDSGRLFDSFGAYAFGVAFGNQPRESLDPQKLDKLHENFDLLNQFLEGKKFVTGDHITVADHSLVSSVTSIEAAGIDISRHRNVTTWVKRCEKEMPGYAEVQAGLGKFGDLFRPKLFGGK